MSGAGQWGDLAPRLMSGVVMAVAGGLLVWGGGWPLAIAISALGGLMIWEAARMFGAPRAAGMGCMGAAAVFGALVVPGILVLPILLAAAIATAGDIARERAIYAALAVWALVGCYAVAMLRAEAGLGWIVWLVLVVVVSDVAGYFAGRKLGGPKFWPKVSPKKTWSGTIAGWIGAAVVGAVMAGPLGAGAGLIVISVLVSLAGQMGDIAESAVKRRVGVKDSSELIPGHGGVLDRFDAMLGAGVLVFVLMQLGLMPGVA
ncbi:phosphatidate cytidylyltransferase [Roseovarius sp. MMSF_3281]|uniref:phosphatidate cytidylyltransferase n=1 Tax=Roseovarius sp. MMSF_3281 TaxID=3046694 RepID=UPI00273FFD8E|nr:phosphatidate cytidylyltransferase [Roseovarius sp. MMSF_3281]